MAGISTYQELRKVLEEEVGKAIERASQRILKILKDQIDTDIYKSYTPKEYERTGQFKHAWFWTGVLIKTRQVINELYYDKNSMNYVEQKWQHGSRLYKKNGDPIEWRGKHGDAREWLAEILNQDSNLSPLWITVDKGLDHRFWENFLDKVFDQGGIEKIILEEFKKSGLKVTRI